MGEEIKKSEPQETSDDEERDEYSVGLEQKMEEWAKECGYDCYDDMEAHYLKNL